MLFRFGGICERPIDGEARWLERCTTYRTLQFNVCRRCWRTKYRASVSCGDACDRPKIPVGSGVSAHALLTEKFGEVRIPRKSGLDPAPVTGGPQNILQEGDSGLLDVVLDPAFETNQTVFITFNEGTKEQNHLAVFRAKFDGATLSGGKVIFRNSPEKAGPRSNSTNSAVSDWRPLLLAPWSLTTSPRFRFCNFLRSLCLTNGMEPCGTVQS